MLPASVTASRGKGRQPWANSGRWMQWKYASAEGPGDAISTGDVFWRVMSKLKELYAKDGGTFPEPILAANTDFVDGKGRYDPERVAKYINGYFLKDVTINGVEYKKGECVPGFPLLQADGSTSRAGNWICSGSFTCAGENSAKRCIKGRSHRARPLPRMVLLVAGQPPRHLQPRFRGPAGQAVESEKGAGAVEGRAMDRRRAGRSGPAAGHAGCAAVHHAAGGPRRPVRPRTG